MKKNRLLAASIIFNLLVFFNFHAFAEQLRVSIPRMPVHAESDGKGILVDFARVLAKKLKQDIDIQIVPFSRSIYYVSNNKVDLHLPFIKAKLKPLSKKTLLTLNNSTVSHQEKQQANNFSYSDETIFHVNFVLYSHKDIVIDIENISNYKIETDTAHVPYFEGVEMGSDCILCSLKKIQYKMTDGYIFADSSTDPLLKYNSELLPSIKRELFQRFEVKVLFPNTEKGRHLNKAVSAIITEMRTSGELAQLLSSIDLPYDDWQLTANN
ncbi:hypothetical protein [Colwellia sp. PAMC 21821]|uniref:hypothetical protein n=1 Tax=Colwellia sp. PAMC 21821 TaxID=1816219 RepID=UPI0009BD9E7D|nr:hypothetical protein [Colwellia sp. PAMC 21821]ARD43383.1 hypothetical protein A3Q33_03095 [Colwellia sp. PAMC 21821]